MKFKKLLFGFSSLTMIAAPVATVVACGDDDDDDGGDAKTVNTQGYAGTMTKLESDDITMGGAWADARFYANDPSSLHTVGVEKLRISNDGIQVKPGMKSGDQYAVQQMFKALITESQTNADLQIDQGGDVKSIFQIYSHGDYTETSDQVTKLDMSGDGGVETVEAYPDTANKPDDAGDFDMFAADAATLGGYKLDGDLQIAFIPSSDATYVNSATAALEAYMNTNITGGKVTITVTSDYDTAATQLQAGQFDIAFLPVDTWAEHAPDSNFVLQAARQLQVNSLSYNGSAMPTAPDSEITNEDSAVQLLNRFGQLYVHDIATKDLAGAVASTPGTVQADFDVTDASGAITVTVNSGIPNIDDIEAEITALGTTPTEISVVVNGVTGTATYATDVKTTITAALATDGTLASCIEMTGNGGTATAPTLSADQQAFVDVLSDTSDPLHDYAVAAQQYSDANGDVITTGNYEAWMYTRIGSDLDNTINDIIANSSDKHNWKADWSEISGDLTYGYTSKTSSASYTFPQLWFMDHFDGFSGL